MANNVCWTCRWVMPRNRHRHFLSTDECPKGHELTYTNAEIPGSRDDHMLWQKAQGVHKTQQIRRRRRPPRVRPSRQAIQSNRQLRALRRKLAKAKAK